MELKASARFLRISPRKIYPVLEKIRGLHVGKALDILALMPQRSASVIRRLLKSAVANAEQKASVDLDNLHVKSVFATQGPKRKMFMPRAMGRAARIIKRTSHIHLVLEER